MRIGGTSTLFFFGVLSAIGCSREAHEDDVVDESESSIVGGTTTTKYEAVGALVEDGEPFCTGTVIAARRVLTAAHCLVGVRASNVRFVLGPNAYAPTATLRVSRVRPHPAYDDNDDESEADIGIVDLAEDANVAPIPRNTTKLGDEWIGKTATFVGYGVTNGKTGAGIGKKRVVTMPITELYGTELVYEKRGANTCSGDSGGPALAKNEDGVMVVIGVTSWGDEDCTEYGVDTRVDAYRTWVGQALR